MFMLIDARRKRCYLRRNAFRTLVATYHFDGQFAENFREGFAQEVMRRMEGRSVWHMVWRKPVAEGSESSERGQRANGLVGIVHSCRPDQHHIMTNRRKPPIDRCTAGCSILVGSPLMLPFT